MKKYIGTKQVEAESMTMGEAFEKGLLQTGRVPTEAEKGKSGYHVKYKDGYESWSPAEPFENAYRVCDTFMDRLQIESIELYDKQEKLSKFFGTDIFQGLSTQKQVLLRAQFGAMEAYRQILTERIRIEGIVK